jgi:hypothetical protein
MKKTATVLTLFALPFLSSDIANAQALKPSVEYSATWDVGLNRWRDTVRTFEMSYTPEYTLISRSPKYQTTYSGFAPVIGDVYQSRFFWDPKRTYSRVQIDSIHENGSLTPIRLDLYDRTPTSTTFTRSTWNGSQWTPIQSSVSTTDEMGIVRSSVNHNMVAGVLTLTDSTHVDVTQDFKGNVTNIKMWKWMIPDPALLPVVEQKYTLNGDGSIAAAEVWNNSSGEFAKAFRMQGFDWVVRDKSFPYVIREQGVDLMYGGDGFKSMTVDLPFGDEWNEFYQVTQTFDDQNRVTSYGFSGMTRDTFAFDGGLISLNQHDDYISNQWMTSNGTRMLFDRDANGTLRSVISQRYNASTSQYVNEKLYFYAFGTSSVKADEEIAISVYPNPVVREIHVRSSEPIEAVSIYDVTGNTLLRSVDKSIDVSTLTPGTYAVRIRTQSGERTLKFVKSN